TAIRTMRLTGCAGQAGVRERPKEKRSMESSTVSASRVLQRVPLGPLGPGAPAHPLAAAAGRPLQPLRALVVDDDRDLRHLLSDLIEDEQFAAPVGVPLPIDQAENGRDALATLRADPDAKWIILLDLRMPELDGMQAWRAIAADATLAGRCAVALVTADDAA